MKVQSCRFQCDNVSLFVCNVNLAKLTFQFLSLGSTWSFIQQTIHIILQQSSARHNPININIVVFRRVPLRPFGPRYRPRRHHLLMVVDEDKSSDNTEKRQRNGSHVNADRLKPMLSKTY